MSIFVWFLALFAAAIGLAVTARFNPGNMVLFYPPYRVDLSLNLFLLLLLLLFIVLYFILNTIRATREMPAKVVAYRHEKRQRESNRALRDALKALFEGRFGHAEKAARRAAGNPENAGLSALIGARAAHRLRQPERSEEWLTSLKEDHTLKIARLMTAIEVQIDEYHPERALDAIAELNATGARHIHALHLALKAHQHARNWPEVLRLTRVLDKHGALHPALSRRLREMAYEDLLGSPHDAESIRRVWSAIPPADRMQPFIAARAARAFNVHGLHNDARMVVEKALAADWDSRLVRAYRESAAPEGTPELLEQIERCEEWIHQRPSDAELALTLGTMCLRQKLWGKAQHFLEQALSDATESGVVRETHLKLAQLHEALGQTDKAASHYRQCALATML